MFTRDQFQTDPNGSGPKIGSDRPSVYTEPFWNRSGTDPNGSKTGTAFLPIQFWIHLDPFGPVPERSRVNRCRSGPVRQLGTVLVRSRVNVA